MCKLTNNCNGNGVCKHGKCTCSGDFTGADCSVKPERIYKEKVKLGRHEWAHFYTYESVPFELEFDNATDNMEVFVFQQLDFLPNK